jgi:hypothetical protein
VSTVKVSTVPTKDIANASRRYDVNSNKCLHGAHQNVFTLFSHLVKEKDNAVSKSLRIFYDQSQGPLCLTLFILQYVMLRHTYLMDTLVEISKLHNSPSHKYAVLLLAHLTRHHHGNSKHLVFKLRKVVSALVKAFFSINDKSRQSLCYALQNVSQDKPCRQELAVSPNVLPGRYVFAFDKHRTQRNAWWLFMC